MATRSATQVFTGLTKEPFFIECRKKLRAKNGAQLLKIVSIDEMRLELETDTNQHLWSKVLDTEDFDLSVLDDGSFEDALIHGIISGGVEVDSWKPELQALAVLSSGGANAQSFQLIETGRLTSVALWLGRDPGATGTARVGVFAATGVHGVSAVPTGSALASADLDYLDIAEGDGEPTTVAITSSFLPAGTYCLKAEAVGSVGNLRVGQGATHLHAGNASALSGGGTWLPQSTIDRYFAVNVAVIPQPSDRYMLVAECTVQYLPAFGGGQTKMPFRRPARVDASALNPVVI